MARAFFVSSNWPPIKTIKLISKSRIICKEAHHAIWSSHNLEKKSRNYCWNVMSIATVENVRMYRKWWKTLIQQMKNRLEIAPLSAQYALWWSHVATYAHYHERTQRKHRWHTKQQQQQQICVRFSCSLLLLLLFRSAKRSDCRRKMIQLKFYGIWRRHSPASLASCSAGRSRRPRCKGLRSHCTLTFSIISKFGRGTATKSTQHRHPTQHDEFISLISIDIVEFHPHALCTANATYYNLNLNDIHSYQKRTHSPIHTCSQSMQANFLICFPHRHVDFGRTIVCGFSLPSNESDVILIDSCLFECYVFISVHVRIMNMWHRMGHKMPVKYARDQHQPTV